MENYKKILELLQNDLAERKKAISIIIERIQSNEIKHSSKIKKEKDLNIQTGFLMALEVIENSIEFYKKKGDLIK